MSRAVFDVNVSVVLDALRDLEPNFSTQRSRLKAIIESIEDVEAVLAMIEAYRPTLLSALEASATEELSVIYDDPPAEVVALVKRYVGKAAFVREKGRGR